MSMITATAWVPRGFAKEYPTKYNLDEGEFSRISKLAQLELDDAKEDLVDARNNGSEPADESDTSDEVEDNEDNAPCESSILDRWGTLAYVKSETRTKITSLMMTMT